WGTGRWPPHNRLRRQLRPAAFHRRTSRRGLLRPARKARQSRLQCASLPIKTAAQRSGSRLLATKAQGCRIRVCSFGSTYKVVNLDSALEEQKSRPTLIVVGCWALSVG